MKLIAVIIFVCAVLLMGFGPAPSASAASAAAVPAVAAVATAVRVEHFADYTATLSLAVDGREVCRIALTPRKTHQLVDACTFDLPLTARDLQVSGEYAFTRSRKLEQARGSRRFRIVDLAPAVSPLRDTSRPFGQRVRAFISATETLKQSYPAFAQALQIEAAPGETGEAVTTAQARLGFALPSEHVSLLREIGALRIGDSWMMRARYLNRAYQQMIEVWGSSAASLKEALAPPAVALLQASTILYTEAGDGYAALLYEPAVPGRPSACGQQPAFYWLHQDEINEPRLLTRRDGKTCRSYGEAMLWLFMMQALSKLEDEDASLALVDRSTPAPLQLELRYEPAEDGRFPFALFPVWTGME